ncbi:MAG: ABC transporter ATP-binding protein, partial [Oleiphilaceae bacterium]|nr:ABC transporter ATP-binding protein [Oleiphilaceae bacterium]
LSVAARRQQGLAYIPEDRLGRGAVPNMDLFDNAMLTAHHRGLHRRGWVRRATVEQYANAILSRFGVKAAHGGVQAKALSGGNLQKFVVGREVLQQPKLLLCANPTWGVDIGSAIMIRHALMDLRDQGAALILVSEDVEELLHLCDRIGAIYNGRLSPIVSTRDTSLHAIGEWMTGSFLSENSAAEGVV